MNLFIRKNVALYLLWGFWAIGLAGYVFYDLFFSPLFVPVLFFLALLLMLINIMFKKKTDSNNEVSPVVNIPVQPNAPLSNSSQDSAKTSTIIASGTQVEGNINLNGDIQIYGTVIGDLTVAEGTIRLMRSGNIEGNLTAPHITVDGSINGVCISDNLEILEHGRLKGIVKGTNFSIKKGGFFTGQSEISEDINNTKGKVKQYGSPSTAALASEQHNQKSKEQITADESSVDTLSTTK